MPAGSTPFSQSFNSSVSQSRGRAPGRSRPRRSLLLRVLLPALLASAVLLVIPMATAHAQCSKNPDCPAADVTRTSSLEVFHAMSPGGAQPDVEPDSGETIAITATYRIETTHLSCDCDTRTASVTVSTTRSGTVWSANCTGCGGASPFVGVAVCDLTHCSGARTYGYELLMDLVSNMGFVCGITPIVGALVQVDYTTTAVDDGVQLNALNLCNTVGAVSPTSQTWNASDTGTFECAFTCAGATGPRITILYN